MEFKIIPYRVLLFLNYLLFFFQDWAGWGIFTVIPRNPRRTKGDSQHLEARPELQDWLRSELFTVENSRTGPFSNYLGNNFELYSIFVAKPQKQSKFQNVETPLIRRVFLGQHPVLLRANKNPHRIGQCVFFCRVSQTSEFQNLHLHLGNFSEFFFLWGVGGMFSYTYIRLF